MSKITTIEWLNSPEKSAALSERQGRTHVFSTK